MSPGGVDFLCKNIHFEFKYFNFSPLAGFLFLYVGVIGVDIMLKNSRPLLGVSIFLRYRQARTRLFREMVFVPFSGFLFFYRTSIKIRAISKQSSSPSRGFYFSTEHETLERTILISLRPLLGVSIFLPDSIKRLNLRHKDLRPLLGVSIFLLYSTC